MLHWYTWVYIVWIALEIFGFLVYLIFDRSYVYEPLENPFVFMGRVAAGLTTFGLIVFYAGQYIYYHTI